MTSQCSMYEEQDLELYSNCCRQPLGDEFSGFVEFKKLFRDFCQLAADMWTTSKVPRLVVVVVGVLLAVSASVCGSNAVTLLQRRGRPSAPLTVSENVCRVHDDFRVCMNPIKSKCNDRTNAVTWYNDMDTLVGYTCKKENFDEYAKHASSLLKTEMKNKAKPCFRKINNFYVSLPKGGYNTTFIVKACQTITDHIDCVDGVVSTACDGGTCLTVAVPIVTVVLLVMLALFNV
ncbi:hypothetical protein LSAT2_014266 [Lamellibrachia satsuma]|nr:hypothetical protein LSAT2_014266 [Lamellibrachia satsuma]